MPWESVKLNSGYEIPTIAFGTWKMGNGQKPIDEVEQALDVGLDHIDTAQAYRNEYEAGRALNVSGLARSDVFVTTKWSGLGGLNISTSIRNSLSNLGLSYVDLYLVHSPRLAQGDIPGTWKQMEEVQEQGLAKSIGVSNFEVPDLEVLLDSAKIKPAVNQILFHPYVYKEQAPILEYSAQHGIIIESYSALTPVTNQRGGPLDAPIQEIGDRLGATPDQILLAWAKAKGTVLVTTSSKRTRLEGYLAAGDITLTAEDIETIDIAGGVGEQRIGVRTAVARVAGAAMLIAILLALYSCYTIRRKRRDAAKRVMLDGDDEI